MRRMKLQKKLNMRAAALAPAAPRPVVEMTFAELCNAYIAVVWDGADYRTKKWVEAFGDLSAWVVERDTLERCIADMMAAGYKPSSINRDISQIGSIYKWAARRRMSPKDFKSPTAGIERLKEAERIVHLSAAECKKLLAGSASFRDRRFQAYVHLLHDTGARKSELLLRRWKEADLDRGTILCDETKTDKPRVLFFSPKTADLLRRIFPRRHPEALLFEGRNPGAPVDFKKAWLLLVARIGRPDLRQHDLRHVVAQRLLKNRVTIAVATQVMGHSSNILQKRYGHLEIGALQDAALGAIAAE